MIKIQNYYSEDPGKVPSKDNLDVGQLWINIKDKKIGTKDSKNVIQHWSQFDPAEKQQALNSIPKTGDVSGITMSQTAKQSTGNTININNDSNVVVAHTLENGTTTITIEKTTGFKATQLVLSKPEGITAQISWVGVDHWLSTVDVPVFGKDAAAQELSVAIFSSPTSVAVNVIYNTETPIDSDITEAKWGNITGNLIDQSDLQAALSLKANASDIPDTSDVLTKTEASTTYLGISAKAASAAQADTAVKATQDADGNTITQTYATKSEVNTGLAGKANSSHTHTKSQITDFPEIPDTSTLIPKTGARGNLAGYESVKASTASTVIDVSSADAMTISGVEAGATITITATVKNVSSTKVVRVTGDDSWQIMGSGSPTNGVTLKWAGGTAPTIKANMLLVINYTGNGNEVFCNAIPME